MTKRLLGTFVASLGMLFVLAVLAAPARAAYNSNNIIDDARFTNHTTMDEAAIQAFLNARNSGLKNYVDPSVNQSAAKIIRDAAWDFGINPQVIMATLQKEQSLMTNPTPSASNINFAMGYGCPTTGSCSFPGFYTQVRNGSWQLRFNMHRAAGNSGTWVGPSGQTWGNSSIVYACRNATSYYSTGLFPGRNVTFYAHTNGQAYANITIANASTAAMYCYTPHVYNPSGTPVYYSGSYNFVVFYERWFGPTNGRDYQAVFYRQSSYPSLLPGQTATGFFDYRNIGNQTWFDTTSAGANSSLPTNLSTGSPVNRSSIFGAAWGPNRNRPSTSFAAVYESDGTTPAADQKKVLPGQIVRFSFTFTVPPNASPGVYRESLRPVLEGAADGAFLDPGTYIDVTVQRPTYTAQFYRQSSYPSLLPGQTATGFFDYRNIGNQTWFDTTSAGANSSLPTNLSTGSPVNRSSIFGAAWGPNRNRPSTSFAAVYESDGTTPAADQKKVLPGQIVRFSFTFTVPPNASPGVYRESLRPVLEGAADGAFLDPGTYIDVTVQRPRYSAAFAGQSVYPTIARGSTASGYVQYRNTGNIAWYDDTSRLSGPAGTLSTRLSTGSPVNRSSIFGAAWGPNRNRPSTSFAAVYESDGTTPASNQNVVLPGQIGRFNFIFTVSPSQPNGNYREYFRPVLEGSLDGAFTFTDVWIDVAVQ